jgi:gp16 family phage-associated protein
MRNHALSTDLCLDANMKTLEQVRAEFHRAGRSITDWAATHGYPVYLVQQVLSGRSRCLRGKSHEIAVLLELKDGYIVPNAKDEEAMP